MQEAELGERRRASGAEGLEVEDGEGFAEGDGSTWLRSREQLEDDGEPDLEAREEVDFDNSDEEQGNQWVSQGAKTTLLLCPLRCGQNWSVGVKCMVDFLMDLVPAQGPCIS